MKTFLTDCARVQVDPLALTLPLWCTTYLQSYTMDSRTQTAGLTPQADSSPTLQYHLTPNLSPLHHVFIFLYMHLIAVFNCYYYLY